jgi:signal transduction histidine kinase
VNPHETLTRMLEGLSRALGYRRAVVALYDPARGALRGTVGLNVPDALVESIEIPLGEAESPMVIALREGVPVRVDDTRSQSRLHEDALGLLLEMEITSFAVVPLRSSSEQFGLATWQGHEPAVGVVILSKDETITDADIERLMPFATQAGTALARASDVERLKDSSAQHAVEKEWLYWMVNGFADPVVLVDANKDIILQNVRAETLFKADPDASEGKRRAISMNNFLFTAALSSNLEQNVAGRSARDVTLVDPIEGTELLFEMRTLPATNDVNGARGTIAVLTNITDLRHATEQVTQNVHRLQSAEEEIRLERDRLNLIMRSVPNPIILLDIDNQPILMNHEALRMFQPASPSPDNRHARSAQVCITNEAKFTSFVSQLRLDPAQGMIGELVLTDPDSREPLTMSVTSTEVRDELGAVAATVSVLQDVSRLRELERRRLEQILFDSEKLAATGRLAASIAHEINNPLEAIKNALYLLTHKTASDDPNAKFLEIATKETDRVSRILRQMLGFYRAPKMEPTRINDLIEESEGLIEKHLRQNRVRIENDLDSLLPPIIASSDQLKQVLLNLMLNAQQAMPKGGTIFVSTRVSHGADQEFLMSESVHIQIRDTGKGIAEEHLPHIFEPFFSTKDEKGTGLGLWVSQGIVQAHGGSIKLRSRRGRGTTFSVALPIGGPEQHVER